MKRSKSARRVDPAKLVEGNPQMHADTWYAIQHDIEVTECCTCGLVHETEYKLERGRIWWRSRINSQATSAARTKLKKEKP